MMVNCMLYFTTMKDIEKNKNEQQYMRMFYVYLI